MIYRVASATVKPGKMQEARQVLLDIAAHMTGNYGHKVEVLSNIDGAASRLHMVGHHESLGALESVLENFKTDSKGQEFVAKVSDLFENDIEFSHLRVES